MFGGPGPGAGPRTRGASLFRISWKACKLLVPELDLEAMPWPLASDFQTILQNPKIAFRDPYLRSCSIERDRRGQPRAWAGSFAVVYKGIDARGTPWRSASFPRSRPSAAAATSRSASYLTPPAIGLPGVVRVPRRGNPLVEGRQTLPDRADGLGRGRNPVRMAAEPMPARQSQRRLRSAARQWPVVAAELSQEQIAHGDLQHANVMVTPQGELKLVDYDGMCVPALIGASAWRWERRPTNIRNEDGAFAAFLAAGRFLCAADLRRAACLAADPSLWGKYVEQTNNDKLLFREDDFRFPQKSTLRHDLLFSAEPARSRHYREPFRGSRRPHGRRASVFTKLFKRSARRLALAADFHTGRMERVHRTACRGEGCCLPSPVPGRAGGEGLSNRSTPVPKNSGRHAGARVSLPKLRGYEMIAEVGEGA